MKAIILVVLMVLGIGNVYPQEDSYFALLDEYFKKNNLRHAGHDNEIVRLYDLIGRLVERVKELEEDQERRYRIEVSSDSLWESIQKTWHEELKKEREGNEVLEPDNR